MFVVCNLTKMPLTFQGKVIPAKGQAEFAIISDFVTLSRYCNSGKVTYNQFTKVITETTVEKEVVEEPVVETPVETVEPVVVEEPKVEEVVETPEPEVTVEEPVVTEETPVVEKPAKKKRTSKDTK